MVHQWRANHATILVPHCSIRSEDSISTQRINSLNGLCVVRSMNVKFPLRLGVARAMKSQLTGVVLLILFGRSFMISESALLLQTNKMRVPTMLTSRSPVGLDLMFPHLTILHLSSRTRHCKFILLPTIGSAPGTHGQGRFLSGRKIFS